MLPRNTGPVALLGALALTLAACSGDPDASPDPNAAPATAAERDPLPLDAYWMGIDEDWDAEAANDQQMRIEDLVAECMAGEGFDYTPVDYSLDGDVVQPEPGSDLDWTSPEFAQQYGYGITTFPWEDSTSPAVDPPIVDDWVDPNIANREAMSDAERAAYDVAMWGDQSVFEDFTEEDLANHVWTWEDGGCYGWAQHEVLGDAVEDNTTEFEAMWADMDSMYLAIQEDSRLAEAVDAWSDCMADAGYPGFVTIWSGQDSINELTTGIWDEVYADVDWDAPVIDNAALDREVRERLSQYSDQEIATAVADRTCLDQVAYDDVEHAVTRDHQQEFIDTHRSELDAYAAQVG